MQTQSHSMGNMKCGEKLSGDDQENAVRQDRFFYSRRNGSDAGALRQISTATTLHGVDSAANLPIEEHLETVGQFAVSFESTQSQKPAGYSHECLNVNPVTRAKSEPPASFLAAVRPS